MQKKLGFAYACFLAICFWLFLTGYSGGPAKSGTAVTGAPFNNNNTCSNCHGGGNFGGAVVSQLLDPSGAVVLEYVPGYSYTFKINFTNTIGTPKYGFQATAAASKNNTNINHGVCYLPIFIAFYYQAIVMLSNQKH